MILLYLLLIILFGFFINAVLNKYHFINNYELNTPEFLSFSSLLGFISFSLYVFILGIVRIKFSFGLFIPIIFCDCLYLFFQLKKIKDRKPKKKTVKSIDYKFLFLTIAFSILFLYFLSYAYFHTLLYPDEFSVWALNAKNIFLGKKLTFFINTGLEIYPDFLPIIYSSFYIFIGKIMENAIRFIPGILFLFLIINLLGLGMKHKINKTLFFLFIIFIMLQYTGFNDYTFSSYGDLVFSCFYTLGILYMFEWLLYEDCKTNMIVSIIYMNAACWTKTDGLPMLAFNFGIIILYYLIKKYSKFKIKNSIHWKKSLLYSLSIPFMGIVWKLYTSLAHFPTDLAAGAGASFEFNIQWLHPLLENMAKQQFTDIVWVTFLTILLFALLLNWNQYTDAKKVYIVFGILCTLFTIFFMLLCYLVVFSGEALIAASYIRYLTRAIFIFMFITLYALENKKEEKIL